MVELHKDLRELKHLVATTKSIETSGEKGWTKYQPVEGFAGRGIHLEGVLTGEGLKLSMPDQDSRDHQSLYFFC